MMILSQPGKGSARNKISIRDNALNGNNHFHYLRPDAIKKRVKSKIAQHKLSTSVSNDMFVIIDRGRFPFKRPFRHLLDEFTKS